jgi:ABC-type glycerol-3-phosphate transport system permease component
VEVTERTQVRVDREKSRAEHRSRRYLDRTLLYSSLLLLLAFALGPLILAWFTAFKTPTQLLHDPYGIPIPPVFENLDQAWNVGHFDIYFKNSVIITIGSVAGMVVVTSLAGYAFGRMHFAGQRVLLFLFLIGLTVPTTTIVIPLYLTMRDFSLLDTYQGVMVAHIATGMPIFVFIMRAFFRSLPVEIDDAARVDGCSEFGVFRHVMLPLAMPGVLTVALLETLWSWNNLLLPLVLLPTDQNRTLPVGLLFYQGRFSVNYTLASAGVLIISVPVIILFFFFQRRFVSGLTGGAVKG